jgi:hypothetical protein
MRRVINAAMQQLHGFCHQNFKRLQGFRLNFEQLENFLLSVARQKTTYAQ